jgi:hypothetical protein
VVPLAVGQSEQALLEDRVALVPQREAEAEIKLVIAESCDPILAPAIGAAARMVMRQVFPGVAMLAVILADGAPLALAEIGAPAAPRRAVPSLGEPLRLRGIG